MGWIWWGRGGASRGCGEKHSGGTQQSTVWFQQQCWGTVYRCPAHPSLLAPPLPSDNCVTRSAPDLPSGSGLSLLLPCHTPGQAPTKQGLPPALRAGCDFPHSHHEPLRSRAIHCEEACRTLRGCYRPREPLPSSGRRALLVQGRQSYRKWEGLLWALGYPGPNPRAARNHCGA